MKYYAEYLIDLCVPWSDESLPSFERSDKGFCLLVQVWSSESATFIERQCFVSCPALCQKDTKVVITRPLLRCGANPMPIGGQR
jgi:hypothetical protein